MTGEEGVFWSASGVATMLLSDPATESSWWKRWLASVRGLPKVIVSVPGVLYAAVLASRSEMRPSLPGLALRRATDPMLLPVVVSAVVVTTRWLTACTAPPNSDVSVSDEHGL